MNGNVGVKQRGPVVKNSVKCKSCSIIVGIRILKGFLCSQKIII